MALDITGLVDYVNENTDLLLTKSFFGAKTADIVRKEGNLMTGVKYSEKIGMLATDAIFQNGAGCTRVSSGSTTLTQRQITVGEIAVVEDLCVKTLNKKYMSKKLAAGSMAEGQSIPFEKEYTDLKSGTIAEQLEIAMWQGDTSHGNANLNKFDGYLKEIDAAGTAVNANLAIYTGSAPISTSTGIVDSNVKAIVKAMWLALPARIQGKSDVRVWCGWDVFQKYVASFTDQNLFNFAPSGSEVKAENGELVIPGTFYKLTAVHGLDGTNRLLSMRTSNMVEAVDLENEEEKWEIIPDQFKNYLRFDVEFKFGVQIGYPDEVVSFKLV